MYSALLKLSSLFFSDTEVLEINRLLSRAIGFDSFERILNKFNYSIGNSFARNKYYLKRDGEIIEDAHLRGDHEKLQLISKKPKKRKAPRDVYWSPAAKYERSESDVNDADLTTVFSQYNVSPDIQQFLLNVPQQDLGWYLPEIKKNPQITLQEVQSIVPKQISAKQEKKNAEQDLRYVEDLEEPYKKWALIEFRKLRRPGFPVDDYAWFKLKLRDELIDWFRSERPQIASYNWKTAIEASDKWHKAISEGGGEIYTEGNQFVVYGPKWNNEEWNGWTIKRVYSGNDLEAEGKRMDNCVVSYSEEVKDEKLAVYSLRDPQNEPHATIGEEPPGSHKFTQIYGKGNEDPKPVYKQMIGEWLKPFNDVVLPGGTDDIYNLSFSSIVNGWSSGLAEEIHAILFSNDDYGIERNFSPDSLYYIFSETINASKNIRYNSSYTPSSLYDVVKDVIQKAIDINSPDLKRIEEYAQHIEEEKFNHLIEYSNNNYFEYKKDFNRNDYETEEEYEEAIETAIETDFEEEINKMPPYSLTNLAFELINASRKDK